MQTEFEAASLKFLNRTAGEWSSIPPLNSVAVVNIGELSMVLDTDRPDRRSEKPSESQ